MPRRTCEEFRRMFSVPDVKKLEDVGTFFSKRSGVYRVEPRATAAQDTAALSLAAIDDMPLIWSKWSTPAQSVSQTSRNKLCINIVLRGSTETLHPEIGPVTAHREVARITTMPEGTRLTNRAHKETLELALPLDQLTERARSFFEQELDGLVQFEPTLDLRTASGSTIVQLLSFLQTNAVHNAESWSHPVVLANTKEFIFTTVLGTLPNSFQRRARATQETALPRVVLRAEEYMRAHADQPLTVEVLANVAGCSERTLQNSFMRFRDTTPMAMLRDIRLEHAHAELKSGLVSVTRCALNWGFTNPGRFTKHYQNKFGEKPSDTAKR